MTGDAGTAVSPYSSILSGMYGLGGLGMYDSYGSYYGSSLMGAGSLASMYNPAFMAQMNQVYQDIETSKLQHSSAMHQLMQQSQTQAYKDTDNAIFQKAMVDASVDKGIGNLAKMIQEGNSQGICQAFEELKQTLYSKYNDYFKSNTNIDPSDSVTNFIETLYYKKIAEPNGDVSLREAISKYGESSFEHGFWKSWHGKDHNQKTAEETASYIYGTPIVNKESKERIENIGAWTEKIAEGGAAILAGRAAGYVLPGVVKAVDPTGLTKEIKSFKGSGKLGKVLACAALAGDILWQISRS